MIHQKRDLSANMYGDVEDTCSELFHEE